jgi:hypothetical protein
MSDISSSSTEFLASELTPQKQQLLLAFHRTCWEEMTWRRNAGYRTVILGLGYCGVLIALVAYNRQMSGQLRWLLAGVMAVATLFGGGYLASNYAKYMSAAARMVLIEQYVGAFEEEFLGPLGALMPAERKGFPKVPLLRNPVCIWSILAFVAGGLLTAVAIVVM